MGGVGWGGFGGEDMWLTGVGGRGGHSSCCYVAGGGTRNWTCRRGGTGEHLQLAY